MFDITKKFLLASLPKLLIDHSELVRLCQRVLVEPLEEFRSLLVVISKRIFLKFTAHQLTTYHF